MQEEAAAEFICQRSLIASFAASPLGSFTSWPVNWHVCLLRIPGMFLLLHSLSLFLYFPLSLSLSCCDYLSLAVAFRGPLSYMFNPINAALIAS